MSLLPSKEIGSAAISAGSSIFDMFGILAGAAIIILILAALFND